MINRRTVLHSLGGFALASAMGPAWARGGLDLAGRDDFLTALAKLRGSTDDRLVIGWVIGARYAVVEHRAIPMMGILAATFSRYRRVSDEAFEARSLEVAYFTDMDSGKLLETWKNPVTGTVVDVPQTRMGPSTVVMTADGLTVPNPAGEAAGMQLDHFFRPAVVVGDHVWVTEEIRVDSPPRRPGGQAFVYNEMSTYYARKSQLDDPARATVPTQVQYHSVITYRPWMGFADAPGHTTARGSGLRAERIEDLPPYYLELTRRHHPDVLDDPLGVLEAEAGA